MSKRTDASMAGSGIDLAPSQADQKTRVATPDDGRCMFFAIANSILIPLLNDGEEFKAEFLNLFPDQETYLSYTRNFLQQVTQKYSTDPRSALAKNDLEANKIYGALIQNFRERTVQTMYDNIIGNETKGIEANPEYYSAFNVGEIETIDEAYLEKMKDPTTWAGNHELCAIADLLNKRIKLPTTIIQQDGQELADANPIVEIHYNGSTHYEAMLSSNILVRSNTGSEEPSTKFEKIQKWKDRFPEHALSGLTDLISVAAYESYNLKDYDHELSEYEKNYLNKAFQVNLDKNPDLIRSLFRSFLLEVEEVGEEYLNSTIKNPAIFDAIIFQHSLSVLELGDNVKQSSAAIHSLIDHDLIRTWSDQLQSESNGRFFLNSAADEEQSNLSRVAFLYGFPLFYGVNQYLKDNPKYTAKDKETICQKYRDLYDQVVSIEVDSSKIIGAILYNPQNLNQAFDEFSADIARGISENVEEGAVLDMMNLVKEFYLPYFGQENYSLFTPFKTIHVKEEFERRAKKFEESKEEVKLEDVKGLLDDKVYGDLYKLCLELVKIHKKQESLSPTALSGKDLLTAFSTELFKEHYYLTGDGFKNFGSNPQVNETLGFLYEIGISRTHGKDLGSDLSEIKSYSDQLRKEIKELKTTREISQKAKEYRSSKIPKKILEVTESLQQLADDVDSIVPDNLAIYGEYIFSISEAIKDVITEPQNVAKNFRDKFSEIEKESNEMKEKIAATTVVVVDLDAEEVAKELAEIEKDNENLVQKLKGIGSKRGKTLPATSKAEVEEKKERSVELGGKKIDLSLCQKLSTDNTTYFIYKDPAMWGKLDNNSEKSFNEALDNTITLKDFAKAKGQHGIKYIEPSIYEIKVKGVERILGSLHRVKDQCGDEVNILNFDYYCAKSKGSDERSSNEYDNILDQIRKSLKEEAKKNKASSKINAREASHLAQDTIVHGEGKISEPKTR